MRGHGIFPVGPISYHFIMLGNMAEEIKKPRPIFERPNVLVAGGAGFIGSWLCEELVKNNKVICIDDFSNGRREHIEFLLRDPNFVFIKWDLNKSIDLEAMQELDRFQIKFQGLQEIYNLACPTNALNYESVSVKTAQANSILMFNMLEMARKYDAKFLHASSSTVYGSSGTDQVPVAEEHIGTVDHLNQRASYNEGKRFAETVTYMYHDIYGVSTKISRIFNVFGPKMPTKAGRMIPDFVHAALTGENIVIYGTESTVSTFCYVGDIVDGMIRHMRPEEFSCLNIGSPIPIKISDVAQKVLDVVGSQSAITYQDPLPHSLPPRVPDISKAKETINWFPLTPLDNGLQSTIDYVVAHRGLIGS